MPRTTSPLLSRGDREVIHELDSSRVLILRRLAMRDDAWLDHDRVIPDAPQPKQFGRALDRERIQDAPVPPQEPSFWRLLILAVVIVLAAVIALPVAFAVSLLCAGVRWFAKHIRSIVRALA